MLDFGNVEVRIGPRNARVRAGEGDLDACSEAFRVQRTPCILVGRFGLLSLAILTHHGVSDTQIKRGIRKCTIVHMN